MVTAAVVGSGPNGLAAAIRLAQAGVKVTVWEAADRAGGGARTSELTLPGLLHDDCSAFHPMGVLSPFLTALELPRHGLVWRWPEIDLAHPLDDGRAGVLSRDMARTIASLGVDGERWSSAFAPLVRQLPQVMHEVLQPVAHLPRHPLTLARFGARALAPTSVVARGFREEPARALFAGLAAHAFARLDRPLSSAVGWMLGAVGHGSGWPVAEGGSEAIVRALVAELESLGGELVTGRRVDSLEQIERWHGSMPDLVMLDVAPAAALRVAWDRIGPARTRALGRFRYGPAAFKVDLAVRGHLEWRNEQARRAGTLHLGGTAAEVMAAERDVVRGTMPARPFVLVGQQYLADPSRSRAGIHPVWAYAHVPHGWRGNATEAVLAQIERFAPGVRRQVVASHVRSAPQMASYNANYVGGDISAGANTARQLVARPTLWRPYDLAPGIFLCSSATPPGGGVHGMCGANAADRALRWLGANPRPPHDAGNEPTPGSEPRGSG